MGDTRPQAEAPAGWLEELAESEADIAAGRIVPREEVMSDLREAIARLEANAASRKKRGSVADR